MYNLGVFIVADVLATAPDLYEDRGQDNHESYCHQVHSASFLSNKDFIFVHIIQTILQRDRQKLQQSSER